MLMGQAENSLFSLALFIDLKRAHRLVAQHAGSNSPGN
jgi:hypothetical protein